jgi:putative ABC transport system permease protein
MNLAWRIYRRLALAFPYEFKVAYGADVMQLGEDTVDEIAKRQGVLGLIKLIADIAMQVAAEYLSELRGDLRYAVRMLLKSPGFALVGILSMGIGIGLTTNVYNTKWEYIFRDLPAAANASRLAMPEKPVSYYYVEQFRQEKNLFQGVAAFQNGIPFNVNFQEDASGKPKRIFGQLVSPDYFSVLGVKAQRGRMLDAKLDHSGDAPVVVVSDSFWRNHLNASPDAIGEVLKVNGQTVTIVGIAPKDFYGALWATPAELFVPITSPPAVAPELANDVLHKRDAKEFMALLCLAPGVTMDSAEAALDTITRNLDEQSTSEPVRMDKGRRVTLLPGGHMVPLPRKYRPIIAAFFVSLMGLIIALACTNLANMLIARGASRRREVAIRLTVGASRFRLIRQMVTEGVLLSLLGGVAGFALAYGLSLVDSRFLPPTAVPMPEFSLDWHAAIFTFCIAMVCGVGFSLAPALQQTKADLIPALKEGSRLRLPGYRMLGLRNLLMVGQVAAALMLLLVTGFLVVGISKTSKVETKFDARKMYLLSADPVRDGYAPAKARDFFEKLPARLRAAGPVESVALAGQEPYSLSDPDKQLSGEGGNSDSMLDEVVSETIGPGYFATLNEPMLEGREFSEQDQQQADAALSNQVNGKDFALPVVINDTAERKLFGNNDGLGKELKDDGRRYEVVGVIRDLKDGMGDAQAVIYFPLTGRDFERPATGGITVLVRSRNGTDALGGIRQEIANLDPDVNLFNVQTLSDYLDRSRATTKLAVQTYGGIGIFGLVLAAIGLAGVTGYAVAQRRKEIAIRTALGSSKGRVLRLVLREGAVMVGVGTVVGFVGAIGIAKMLSSLLTVMEQLRAGMSDPALLIGAPVILATVALMACYVPARKSARIDPLAALREE